MTKKNVMLMGIHGRIGEHLYLELKDSVNLFSFSSPNQDDVFEDITLIKKDLFILPEVEEALQDMNVVIFFEDPIMRLNRLTQGKFNDMYLLIADNIARASKNAGVEQIIYIADELSDGSILSVLGAYGTAVKKTATPIRRYGKNLTYKTKDYNSVRSVQRAQTPPGWTVENIAWYYFGWLDEIVYSLVNTEIKNNTVCIYVLDKPKPVLIFKYNEEISDEDIVIFEITGGSLKKGSTSKTQRFEFRKLPSGDEFIMALHDFEPALPWPVFKMTQAPIHSLVSRIYQVEMIINKDVPEHRPHNNK